MGRYYDITNQRHGRWRVLRRVSQRKWLCRCECGNERNVDKYNLTSGSSRSCGCWMRENNSRRLAAEHGSLIGMKFGKLTVLSDAMKPIKYRTRKQKDRYWLCRCDCGGTTVVATRYLRSGAVKGCGCYHVAADPYEIVFKRVRSAYRASAKKRGLKFNLTDLEFSWLMSMNCHYCGREKSNETTGFKGIRYSGVDRVDSDMGYVSGNVVPCCAVCNRMKLNHGYNEFISHIKRIGSKKHEIEKQIELQASLAR